MSVIVAKSAISEAGRQLHLKDEEIAALIRALERAATEVAARNELGTYCCEAERRALLYQEG